ncbi:DNA-dependent RNA polymerase II [Marasmius sp. AFHP31]|nr:DNA-dependent RNA polymerase II [Marasmius sp. AFHP31]
MLVELGKMSVLAVWFGVPVIDHRGRLVSRLTGAHISLELGPSSTNITTKASKHLQVNQPIKTPSACKLGDSLLSLHLSMNSERERLNIHPPAQTGDSRRLHPTHPPSTWGRCFPSSSTFLPSTSPPNSKRHHPPPPSPSRCFQSLKVETIYYIPKNIAPLSLPLRRVLFVDSCAADPKHERLSQEVDVVQDPYSYDDADFGYDEEDQDGYGKITQEDCWPSMSSFFEQKGLVRQQLDSFDEFVQTTIQELVDENFDLILDQAEQFYGQQTD